MTFSMHFLLIQLISSRYNLVKSYPQANNELSTNFLRCFRSNSFTKKTWLYDLILCDQVRTPAGTTSVTMVALV